MLPHPNILCAGLMQETTKTALAVHAQRSGAAGDDWTGTALLRPMLQGAIRCAAQAPLLHSHHAALLI